MLDEHGALREGAIPADQDGLAGLALTLGGDEDIRVGLRRDDEPVPTPPSALTYRARMVCG